MLRKDPGWKCAQRAENVTPFIVMDVLERAQELESGGKHIVHLEIGEPDFDTPSPAKEAALKALQAGDTHYTHSLGKPPLRRAIAEHYEKKYGVDVSTDQVVVTSGTSPAMLLIFSVLLERGDEVLLPDPHYACYPNYISYLDGTPVYVPVYEKDGFKYRPEKVAEKVTARTRAVMLNTPANPTGAVFDRVELEALSALDLPLVSDEVYSGLVYGRREHTALEFSDQVFIVNGFSKLYAMTGWRLGYLIAPPEFIRPLQKLQQNLFICASSFAQEAAIAALKDCQEHVEEMVELYDRRRIFLLQGLEKLGLAPQKPPEGAFYVLANVKEYTRDSYAFAFEILEKAGVAVTPGIDFGSNCEGYLRISYANSMENIAEGLDRLETFLREKEKLPLEERR